MDFDPRIGERKDVSGVLLRWEPHLEAAWAQRIRQARGDRDPHLPHSPVARPNASIENVSVSGAGVLAPADSAVVTGTDVTGVLGPGSTFEATVRRVMGVPDIGWAYFGVEFTSFSEAFGTWLDHVMGIPQRDPAMGIPQRDPAMGIPQRDPAMGTREIGQVAGGTRSGH